MYEPSIYAAFFVSIFHAHFSRSPNFLGAIVVSIPPDVTVLEGKRSLHKELGGIRKLDPRTFDRVRLLYPDLNETSILMIQAFGFPSVADVGMPKTQFIGPDISPGAVTELIESFIRRSPQHFIFTFIDKIFRGDWIDPRLKLVNGHPGVLPFARGIGALEQLAALGDRDLFCQAAGATIHYIDDKVDAGPVIRCQRLLEPFSYESLSQLRAFNFKLVFDLLADVGGTLLIYPDSLPHGVRPENFDAFPLYLRSHRTLEVRTNAAIKFLAMKKRLI